MKRIRDLAALLVVAGLAGTLPASVAHANLITPGTTVTPDVFTSITGAGVINGTVLATDSGGFTTSTFSGTYITEVIKDSITGFLDFVIRVTNSTTSADALDHITNTSYLPSTVTDVGYLQSGLTAAGGVTSGTAAPSTVDESLSGVLGWNFPFPLNIVQGATSVVLVAKTNVLTFSASTIGIIDGSGATVAGFEPVPGPILGAGLPGLIAACGGLLAFARRRRQQRA